MASEESVHHQVSDAFVEQYYTILRQKPEEAHRFYVDDSVVSRPGPDGTMISFTSLEDIKEQILSCDYDESTTFEILSVDSQDSSGEGIVIMVIGFFTGKDDLKRKFSQMFYLARQNHAHVVLNDIFRYVTEEPIDQPSVSTTEIADVLNKTELIEKVDAPMENSVSAAEEKNANPPLDNGEVKHSDEKAVTAQKAKEPVAETAAPPQLDGAKKSFRDIVQSLARNDAPFQVKTTVQKPNYVRQPRATGAPQAPASVRKSEKRTEQKTIEEPGTSIFVANLPMNAVPAQVHELFKDFGPIKENGIQVRSIRAREACFGFVAFESATSVQSVLQAAKNKPFMLADHKLGVKEKQVDYDGSKPSGRSGGGGSKTQNGSADGGGELRRNRNRRSGGRSERRGDRNANEDGNKKSSEGGAPEVQA